MFDEISIDRGLFGRLQREAKVIDAARRIGPSGTDQGDIHIAIGDPNRTSGLGRRLDRRIIELPLQAEHFDIECRQLFGIICVYGEMTDRGHVSSWVITLNNSTRSRETRD